MSVMPLNVDLLPGLAVLLVPALLALWVRRPRRHQPVVRLVPGPVLPPPAPRPDYRTPEQRAADQARTNDAWGLR